MALKYKISNDDYEKLSDDVKKEYKKVGDDYVLDLQGAVPEEDVTALRRAKEREAQAAKDLRDEVNEMRERLSSLEGDDARKRGDIEALEKSWKDKYENREKELLALNQTKDGFISKTLRDKTAEALAAKISTVPNLMKKEIMDRLTVEMEGDEPALRVLDAEGKPSAMSLGDLEKELVANKDYASIIIASKASGGGAGTDASLGKSGAVPRKPVNVLELSPEEHAARIAERKQAGA